MLVSRVADHCFWFGRYLERADATARSLGSTREALMGADLEERQSWLPIIIATGEQERFAECFAEVGPAAEEDGELVQNYMVWDERNPSSLRATIAAIRSNARSIRDHLSLEVWEQINGLHWWMAGDAKTAASSRPIPTQLQAQAQMQAQMQSVASPPAHSARSLWTSDRHSFYTHVVESMALTTGLMRTTMLRDGPFNFIWLGAMLERANQTARILDVQHHTLELRHTHVVIDTALWLVLLRACAGYEPFMRRHRGRVTGKAVATFLVQDLRFPRSIGFSLDAALWYLRAIAPPGADDRPVGGTSHERLRQLFEWLTARTADDLAGTRIHETLTRVVDDVHAIADQIGVEFLRHRTD